MINYNSAMYRTKEFLAGGNVLNTIELNELRDYIKGNSLLHLQCHFGLDTLSWARLGAHVTGVDISSEAISLAKKLANETNLQATFIESNIYELPEKLNEKFDVVFTSYGVLCWLHDLSQWGEIIAHFLKPNGIFYIAEFHNFIQVFDWDSEEDFELRYNYFHEDEPISYSVTGSYADSEEKIEEMKTYEWNHSLSDVINSLLSAGLQLEFFNEYPYGPFQRFPFLKQSEDGYWRYDNPDIQLPLVFTLLATKK
ncbi:MAG: class I SAM-dependent methyltransferase [Asgard group archaeon]|nr:class I SAM-dependent methyltransferase [Asgard group archaeon]